MKVAVVGAGVGGLARRSSSPRRARGDRLRARGRRRAASARAWSATASSWDAGPSLLTMPWVFADLGLDLSSRRARDPLRVRRRQRARAVRRPAARARGAGGLVAGLGRGLDALPRRLCASMWRASERFLTGPPPFPPRRPRAGGADAGPARRAAGEAVVDAARPGAGDGARPAAADGHRALRDLRGRRPAAGAGRARRRRVRRARLRRVAPARRDVRARAGDGAPARGARRRAAPEHARRADRRRARPGVGRRDERRRVHRRRRRHRRRRARRAHPPARPARAAARRASLSGPRAAARRRATSAPAHHRILFPPTTTPSSTTSSTASGCRRDPTLYVCAARPRGGRAGSCSSTRPRSARGRLGRRRRPRVLERLDVRPSVVERVHPAPSASAAARSTARAPHGRLGAMRRPGNRDPRRRAACGSPAAPCTPAAGCPLVDARRPQRRPSAQRIAPVPRPLGAVGHEAREQLLRVPALRPRALDDLRVRRRAVGVRLDGVEVAPERERRLPQRRAPRRCATDASRPGEPCSARAGRGHGAVEGEQPPRPDRRAGEDRDRAVAALDGRRLPASGFTPPQAPCARTGASRTVYALRGPPARGDLRRRPGRRRARRRRPTPRTAPSAAGRRTASSCRRVRCPSRRKNRRPAVRLQDGPVPGHVRHAVADSAGSERDGRRRRARMEYGLAAIVGYVCGAIPVALLVARRYGVDLLEVGDRNPGAWNALDHLGARRAWPAFVGDGAKAFLPAGRACTSRSGTGPRTWPWRARWSATPSRCRTRAGAASRSCASSAAPSRSRRSPP